MPDNRDVFFNCPFDADYQPFYDAIVFTIMRCGFVARCARERDNGGEVRLDKIYKIIKECRFGVHDISCTELDKANGLPRFNMPLELGIFLAASKFGSGVQKSKICLIFDREQHRYQKFISDIAGQDIHSHDADLEKMIRCLADWLRQHSEAADIPGGAAVFGEYQVFLAELPEILAVRKLEPADIKFGDLQSVVQNWLDLKLQAA